MRKLKPCKQRVCNQYGPRLKGGYANAWGVDTTCNYYGVNLPKWGRCLDSWPPTVERYARGPLKLDGVASCSSAQRLHELDVLNCKDRARKARVICTDTTGKGRGYVELSPRALEEVFGGDWKRGRVCIKDLGRTQKKHHLVYRPAPHNTPMAPTRWQCVRVLKSPGIPKRSTCPKISDEGSPWRVPSLTRKQMGKLRKHRRLWARNILLAIKARSKLNVSQRRRIDRDIRKPPAPKGKKFASHIERFQGAHGLPKTGMLDVRTSSMLGFPQEIPWWVQGADAWLRYIAGAFSAAGLGNVSRLRLRRWISRLNLTLKYKAEVKVLPVRPRRRRKEKWPAYFRRAKPLAVLDAATRKKLGGVPSLYWWMYGKIP